MVPKAQTSFHGWEPLPDPQAQEYLQKILESWEWTPYMAGQQCKGAGVDCVRFVCGVLDEATHRKHDIVTLPPDTCFHAPDTCMEGAARIRALYEPTVSVNAAEENIQPGDVLITGPLNGGPGHAMIVGTQKGVLWHSALFGVHRTGLSSIFIMGYRIFSTYRMVNRNWRPYSEA